MRATATGGGLVGLAIAGTYVVILGWDIADQGLAAGLLGFAIKRRDHASGEEYWLRGKKTFPGAAPLPPGGSAASAEQPFQTFQWGDYTAKPGRRYDYSIVPVHGTPGALVLGDALVLSVTTEDALGAVHSVFFNRGAIASQEYAVRFQNKPPDQVGQAAYDWLSRGLLEAILAFIARATDGTFGLRMAIYEFQWPAVLQALSAAAARGADVKVLYDAIENAKHDPVAPNEEQIHAAGIEPLCQGITHGKIMHNKFVVLLQHGAPISVLTGSTNYTENGIFGHLNCAHIVEDADTAGAYLDYWTEIARDPEPAALRGWTGAHTPTPADPLPPGLIEVFSPQHGTATLTRYGGIAGSASRALFMTFAFGMNRVFLPIYQQQDAVLRFALMDSVGVGRGKAQAEQDIAGLHQVPNAVVAIGQNIALNSFDVWLKERDGIGPGEHVRWVHTKFMLVDPLSDDPLVITGSANFSDASVGTNHENMLIVRDRRVADIYLGEFMRQFSSYAFRDAAAAHRSGDPAAFRPQDLVADDTWLQRYATPGSSGALRRAYFSGT